MSIFDRLKNSATSAIGKAASSLGNKKETFTFAALPLKYQNADGAPIRAVAIIEE